MDNRQLQTFVTLAKVMNYQTAAALLEYAPSTLSGQIRQLEEELGYTLFEKQGRNIVLTNKGQQFLSYARKILLLFSEARNIGKAGGPRQITIGGCDLNTGYSLHVFFERFLGKHSEICLDMATCPNAKVPFLLNSGMAQVGFYYDCTDSELKGLDRIALCREKLSFLASPVHPLAGKKVAYTDLEKYRFIYPHDDCCLVEELARHTSTISSNRVFMGSMNRVLHSLSEQNAVTLAPGLAARYLEKEHGLVCLNLQEEPLYTIQYLLVPSGNANQPEVELLLEEFDRYLMTIPPETGCTRIYSVYSK